MIIHRPTQSSLSQTPRSRRRTARVNSINSPDYPEPELESGFENWVDKKLDFEKKSTKGSQLPGSSNVEMSKSMRKYYNKRRKRMYGSDSEDEFGKNDEGFVELKPEVVEFDRLHQRQEELYFYDTFAYPWEKDKHYKMVYQLEKKYFPDHCLDKAFLDTNVEQNVKKTKKKMGGKSKEKKDEVNSVEDDKKLVFFEEKGGGEEISVKNVNGDASREVSEKKVQEFFNCLKKLPNKEAEVGSGEPYVATRTELPPTWDGPFGTMVLINKPKGESIFMFLIFWHYHSTIKGCALVHEINLHILKQNFVLFGRDKFNILVTDALFSVSVLDQIDRFYIDGVKL